MSSRLAGAGTRAGFRKKRRFVRRYVKRRPFRGRRRRLGPAIGRSLGFPRQQLVKLRYVDNYRNNVMTSGAIYNYQLKANGLFDPNFTGAGHQPFTFDTWASLYNHYRVIGAKITAVVSSATSSNLAAPIRVVAYLSDDSTVYSDYTTMQEAGRGQSATLTANVGSMAKVSAKYSAKRFFRMLALDATTGAGVNADPTEGAIFNILMQPVDQLTTVAADTLTVNVQVDYIVIFMEPKDLAAS